MIISAFINAFYYILSPLISVLPTVDSLPSGLNTGIDWFFNVLTGWHYFIPVVDDLVTVITLALSIEGVILTFAMINWVYNKLRGSG